MLGLISESERVCARDFMKHNKDGSILSMILQLLSLCLFSSDWCRQATRTRAQLCGEDDGRLDKAV